MIVKWCSLQIFGKYSYIMFSFKIDEDTKLTLIEPRHAEELHALIDGSFDHIKEWSGWLKDGHSIEDTHSFIKRNLKQFAANEGFGIAIWYKGEMAGQIEYNYLDWENRKTEIGYWLGESFQGKGLIIKSCRVLIDHAFDVLNLTRIEIRCGAENSKSRKIPEKLGFKEEGIARQSGWLHDRYIDHIIYAILANEWRNANAA